MIAANIILWCLVTGYLLYKEGETEGDRFRGPIRGSIIILNIWLAAACLA